MTFVVAQAEALEEEPARTNYVFQPTAVSNELALEDRATHLEVVRQASTATSPPPWPQTLGLRCKLFESHTAINLSACGTATLSVAVAPQRQQLGSNPGQTLQPDQAATGHPTESWSDVGRMGWLSLCHGRGPLPASAPQVRTASRVLQQ